MHRKTPTSQQRSTSLSSIGDDRPARTTSWHSTHVFIPHSYFDDYLYEVVWPAVLEHKLHGQFFFLRYWQGGPHLRVRYRPGQERAAMVVDQFVKDLRAGIPTFDTESSQEYAAAAEFQSELARLEGEEVIPARPLGNVEAVPYVPELRKYGGKEGVAAAEQVFCATSTWVLETLAERRGRGTPPPPPIGESVHVAAMFLAGSGLGVSDSVGFLEHYESWWSRYSTPEQQASWPLIYERIADNLRAVAQGAWGVRQPADPLFSLAGKTLDSLQHGDPVPARALDVNGTPFTGCLSNYIHTTNNRLGLIPAGEGLLAYLLRRALSETFLGHEA
ncbi:hypothetical protein NNL26_04970 [Micrococcus luteus]|uniref:lantibiotic dehydratase C-terminal domain-containing protein n=1 Tax=Micrococcus luteus TaxID=1270 RepID=UPI0021069656|nr:lantibiotic dehydratase C-terminal domain-containing protein [Micrococcus luteus]UTX35581.1 hypothetical protein NNL26_04970 [Micrococcus luteus]